MAGKSLPVRPFDFPIWSATRASTQSSP